MAFRFEPCILGFVVPCVSFGPCFLGLVVLGIRLDRAFWGLMFLVLRLDRGFWGLLYLTFLQLIFLQTCEWNRVDARQVEVSAQIKRNKRNQKT